MINEFIRMIHQKKQYWYGTALGVLLDCSVRLFNSKIIEQFLLKIVHDKQKKANEK
jgi:hypothetical protein